MTLISVCCCAINSKYEVETLVRTLRRHNDDTHFEIVLTHDDRVEDGSREYFEELKKDAPNFRTVRWTNEDTIEYLERVVAMYRRENTFAGVPEDVVGLLEKNLATYKRGEFLDPSKSFLWLSSGVLYNKAVQASRGEIIIVTPADFLYLFRLHDVRHFVQEHSDEGQFYASPWALWARITNLPFGWVRSHVHKVHVGDEPSRKDFRWDSDQLFIDYLSYPPRIEEFYLPDFRRDKLYCLGDSSFGVDIHDFSRESIEGGGVQATRNFHGFHFMTRQTYDAIGGFTEEWPGRAFADDKMTFWGSRKSRGGQLDVPPHLAVAWIGQGEILPDRGPGYDGIDIEARLKEVDPYWGKHPPPNRCSPKYLNDGIPNWRMAKIVNQVFNKESKPRRIM